LPAATTASGANRWSGAKIRSYLDALLRYFDFSGRSSRTQYWLFYLVCVVLTVAAVFADVKLAGQFPQPGHFGTFVTFLIIFHFIPSLSVTIRRLHDIGKSGWWWLISFVPFAGGFILLYWTCCPSEPWPNDYGDPPGHGDPSPRRGREAPVNPMVERALRARSSRPPNIATVDPASISTRRFI